MRIIIGTMLAIGIVALVGLYLWQPDYVWHQKLTIDVDTPEGVKSGSSTVRVAWRDSIALLPDPPHVTSQIRGEATVVDLGGGRYLFALLNDAERLALKVFNYEPVPQVVNGISPWAQRVVERRGETLEAPLGRYPVLVTFVDISGPSSVRKVDPSNPEEAFGEGMQLKRRSLSVTDEIVTERRVEPILPWLDAYFGKKFDGQRYETIRASNRFANSLSSGAFKAGK